MLRILQVGKRLQIFVSLSTLSMKNSLLCNKYKNKKHDQEFKATKCYNWGAVGEECGEMKLMKDNPWLKKHDDEPHKMTVSVAFGGEFDFETKLLPHNCRETITVYIFHLIYQMNILQVFGIQYIS